MPEFVTACPRNCYSTCSMRVSVRDGRLRMIEPHEENKATSGGICLKGLSYIERVYSPDRILNPLHRTASGSFEKIDWEDALNLICKNIIRLKNEYGPQSILYYTGSGTKGLLNAVGMNFWRLFGGCTTTYGDLCWPAGLEATRLTLGENKHNAPWDLENARLIIFWGKNAAETNIHQMVFADRALQNGAKLVVIDPRRTQTAERAHLLIQPRPGTDGALALGLANVLIHDEKPDISFISRHVHGFTAFKKLVGKYTVQKVSEICGVSPDAIIQLAEWLGEIKPSTINAGFGMQRFTNSGQTMRAMIALLAITGNIGKPGAGWMFANLQSAVFDVVKDPIAFYPPQQPDGVVRVSVSTAKLGPDMRAQSEPPLKMIWVERGNPVTQNPETNMVLKAFRQLDFRVVVDQFMTDTAREADLILPAKSMFEQSDIIGAYWHSYIQLKQKLIDPPGEVKPETEIYYLLAKKLGFSEADCKDKIPAPGDASIESWLQERILRFPDITLDRLREGPVEAPGHEAVAFADLKFQTPSGKIELYSEQAARLWSVDPLPDYRESAESGKRATGKNDKYPLYFLTPNTKNRIHSQFNNLQLIRRYSEKPEILLHPVDAAARGISNGNPVRVFNDRGELRLPAKTDAGLRPGCVLVTNGWWISEGGTVNFLSAARETDMGYGAAFHDNRVEVEKTINDK